MLEDDPDAPRGSAEKTVRRVAVRRNDLPNVCMVTSAGKSCVRNTLRFRQDVRVGELVDGGRCHHAKAARHEAGPHAVMPGCQVLGGPVEYDAIVGGVGEEVVDEKELVVASG